MTTTLLQPRTDSAVGLHLRSPVTRWCRSWDPWDCWACSSTATGAGRSAVEYGLAALELEAGDTGLRTFVSVQGSLAMNALHKFGSEEQKQRWLPAMAAGEAIGCSG